MTWRALSMASRNTPVVGAERAAFFLAAGVLRPDFAEALAEEVDFLAMEDLFEYRVQNYTLYLLENSSKEACFQHF